MLWSWPAGFWDCSSPGKAPVDVTADHIVIGEEPWEQDTMQELASHISSMWVPWGDVARPCDDAWSQ